MALRTSALISIISRPCSSPSSPSVSVSGLASSDQKSWLVLSCLVAASRPVVQSLSTSRSMTRWSWRQVGSELLLLHRVSSRITLARQPSLSSSSTVRSCSRPGWVVTLVLTRSRMEIFSLMSSVLLSSLASSWSLTAGAAAPRQATTET